MVRVTAILLATLLATAGTVRAQQSDAPGDPRNGVAQDPSRGASQLPELQPYKINYCPPLSSLGYSVKRIDQVKLDISLTDAVLPPDCSTDLFPARQVTNSRTLRADWPDVEFNWAATEFYHQPLYFEDIPLERYGQAYRPLLQPWLSGARFFATFPILPYRMGIDRIGDHIYSLGYYRPGSPTPCLRQRLPLEWDAATFESAAWLALVFALP
jgi:hypothetical protein